MSKLSVHVSSGNRSGFGEWLAKSKPAVVYSVNENVRGDIVSSSPNTKLILRRQTDTFNRLPNNFFQGDPVVSATDWLIGTRDPADKNRTQMENILLNSPDWASVDNEPIPDIPIKAQWMNTWAITALEIAHQHGVKLALFSFATGSPPIEMWQYLIPALKLGRQYGAILSLHSYWDSDPALDHDNALRYREIYKVLPEDAKLPVVVSEASSGNGYNVGLSGQAWVNDMARYDSELMKDSYVLSACGFQLGGQESNSVSVIGAYGDYIAAHPTPAVPPVIPPAFKHYLVSDIAGLRIRSLPTTNSTVLATLNVGSAVQVDSIPTLADGYVWYKIVVTPYINCFVAGQRSAQNYAHLEVR